jgi:Mn2+/Fe2+ NRAMP family transporter
VIAGASHGFAPLWTTLVTFPLMAAVQSISARLALVSGKGLTAILRKRSPRLVYVAVFMLVVANTINVGADLGAIVVGMGLPTLVMYSIILSTAATLFQAGQHNIQTAAEAARALRPLAGNFAEVLFAAGMIGTGLLAVPVLSGSAGHAVAELFDWRAGFDASSRKGEALLRGHHRVDTRGSSRWPRSNWTAVLNDVIAPPLLALIMLGARDRRVMGERAIGPVLTTFGWAATCGMFFAPLALLYATVV